MRNFLIASGVILIAIALYYFIGLVCSMSSSFEFSNYGYGILAGKLILLLIGGVLMYFGIRMKKSE